MCHTLPRIGYKSPYNRRVESRDSEEGDAKVKEAGKHAAKDTFLES